MYVILLPFLYFHGSPYHSNYSWLETIARLSRVYTCGSIISWRHWEWNELMITRKNGAPFSRGGCAKIIFLASKAHQNVIIRELSSITSVLRSLEPQIIVTGFITASDDAGRIKDWFQKIEHALTVYQVCPLRRRAGSSPDQKRIVRYL
jgi:hypothetical protein